MEEPKHEIAKNDGNYMLAPAEIGQVVHQVAVIQEVMQKVMKNGEHYGVIPGCKKPSLLKPGAEKLSLTFRIAPEYDVLRNDMANGHRGHEVMCRLYTISDYTFLGAGVGSCSTMENKYRFRNAALKCPKCSQEAIIKGKEEYGGGWVCYKKKGGCGETFYDGDATIEDQPTGKVEHDNPADHYNTVLKMAKKRAHIDAVLTVTAASDIFTQDVEDLKDAGLIQADYNVKDTPAEAPAEKPAPAQGDGKITEGQVKSLVNLYQAKGWTGGQVNEVLGAMGCDTIGEVPAGKFQEFAEKLKAGPK